MTRLTDGKRTVAISMATWDGSNWSPDFSGEFFADCEYSHEHEALVVEDVNYCVDYANEWKNGTGDFASERIDLEEMGVEFDPDNRLVDVIDL